MVMSTRRSTKAAADPADSSARPEDNMPPPPPPPPSHPIVIHLLPVEAAPDAAATAAAPAAASTPPSSPPRVVVPPLPPCSPFPSSAPPSTPPSAAPSNPPRPSSPTTAAPTMASEPSTVAPTTTHQPPASLPNPSANLNSDAIPSLDTISKAHSAFLSSNPPTNAVKLASGALAVSKTYGKRRKKTLIDFVSALKKMGEKYAMLLTKTSQIPPSFNTNETSIEKVFVALSGTEGRRQKVRLLSDMLIDWVSNLEVKKVVKKSNSKKGSPDKKKYHAPATLNVLIRNFLAAAKEYYDWHFTMADFNFEGGYNGFFRLLMEERQREDVSCYCCDFINFFSIQTLTFTSIQHSQHTERKIQTAP